MNDNEHPGLTTIRKALSKKTTIYDWLGWIVVIIAIIALPGGLVAAWYFDNSSWALISVGALIFFYAG